MPRYAVPGPAVPVQARAATADCLPVGRLDFAQLLDEKVRETASSRVERGPAPIGNDLAAPAHPLLFAVPYQQFRVSAYPATEPSHARRVASTRVAPSSTAAHTPATRRVAPLDPAPMVAPVAGRRLTPGEMQSLQMLNALGARLSADFSMSDLRSAYRRLARRYHPDRHPNGGVDHLRWTRLFAEITTHHRHLTRALDRHDH
jgi:hypothetical protein